MVLQLFFKNHLLPHLTDPRGRTEDQPCRSRRDFKLCLYGIDDDYNFSYGIIAIGLVTMLSSVLLRTFRKDL
jgi:hypothetical protein